MDEKSIILVYKGEFTQTATKSVLAMTEQNMEVVGEVNPVKRKVFYVMMECLQNICKHSEKMATLLKRKILSVFVVGKNHDDGYFIITGNPMLKENQQELSNTLNLINNLDRIELRQYHRNKIQVTQLSEKGGAGLGFIEIAKKTNRKLDFNFENIDDELVFFSLKITISQDGIKAVE